MAEREPDVAMAALVRALLGDEVKVADLAPATALLVVAALVALQARLVAVASTAPVPEPATTPPMVSGWISCRVRQHYFDVDSPRSRCRSVCRPTNPVTETTPNPVTTVTCRRCVRLLVSDLIRESVRSGGRDA